MPLRDSLKNCDRRAEAEGKLNNFKHDPARSEKFQDVVKLI